MPELVALRESGVSFQLALSVLCNFQLSCFIWRMDSSDRCVSACIEKQTARFRPEFHSSPTRKRGVAHFLACASGYCGTFQSPLA
jgi:hypothetical protein